MQAGQPLLILGNSVRYLAQSAARHGHRVTGLDLFADRDAVAACQRMVRSGRRDAAGLVKVALDLDMPAETGWIYGAGFEAAPAQLHLLESLGPCLGNGPRTLELLSSPEQFFGLLDEQGISYPPVSFQRLQDPRGWLIKSAAGFGGLAVRDAVTGGPVDDRADYYQRRLDGQVCSLTFLANGRDLEVLGINRLHAVDGNQGDYRFSTALSGFNPGQRPAQQMVEMAGKLTRALQLRGANSIDCLLDGDQLFLLELNARPPATLELYEQALPQGGAAAHIAACRGELLSPVGDGRVRGYRICYAERELVIGQFTWPVWCSDLPATGSRCELGSPICGVHADGATAAQVERLLQERIEEIKLLIELSGQEAA